MNIFVIMLSIKSISEIFGKEISFILNFAVSTTATGVFNFNFKNHLLVNKVRKLLVIWSRFT